MSKSIKKMTEKLEYQNRVNPGHQEAYNPPPRPRSAVFKSKKDYNRQQDKIDIKKGRYDE